MSRRPNAALRWTGTSQPSVGAHPPLPCARLALPRRGQKQAMNAPQVAERGDTSDPQYSLKAAISREMVRLYKEQFGRGPTRSRTEFAGPDIVVATLEDTFTPAERRLAEMGQVDR